MKTIFLKLLIVSFIIGIIPFLVEASTSLGLTGYQESGWTDWASSETTPSLTWSSGDVVVCVGGTRDSSYTLNTPTASGLTFSLITSASGNTRAYAWSATAGSGGSGAVTATSDGTNTNRGLSCFVFSGSDGIGNSATLLNSSAKTISLTRNFDNSNVVFVAADYYASSDTTVTPAPSGGTERVAVNVSNIYSAFVFNWGDQGPAGATSYGITDQSGSSNITGIAIEIKGRGEEVGGPVLTAPVISSFASSPSSITSGQSSTLSWSVSGNPTPILSVTPGNPSTSSGSVSVSPSQTTTYTLTATNSQGSVTVNTTVTVSAAPQPDTTPPSTPTNLSATTISSSQINLSWSVSSDNVGVTGYDIYRGGTLLTSVTGTSYSNAGLTPNTSYSYTVRAKDSAGNVSGQSSSVSATTQAQAPTGGAINCDLATLQATVNAAARGAIITCNAGNWSWSGTLNITKGISIYGASRNTVISRGGTMVNINPDSTALANEETVRLEGFTFDGNNSAPRFIEVYGAGPTANKPFKNLVIGNNIFRNAGSSSGGGSTIFASGQIRGVIFNNLFDRVDVVLRAYGNDYTTEWENGNFSFAYGNSDNLFFENNTIQYSSTFSGYSPGWTETGQGGRLVLRYNTWNLANTTDFEIWDVHGFQYFPNGQTGTMVSEYYGNTVSNAKSYRWIYHRGSWGVFFNNIANGTGGMGIDVASYTGGCTSSVPGASGNYITEVNNTYFWNNEYNGIIRNAGENQDPCGIAENSHYWNYNPSFNGSSGVGRGTSVPTGNCTIGVGYWKANTATPTTSPGIVQNGTLYKCTSPNAWTPYYTPFTYPHPLVSGSTTPPPPTTHTLTASAGTGGTISPSGSVSVTQGNSQTFTITPSSGYSISSVLIDGTSVGSVSSYTFSNITTNHTISATFTANQPVPGDFNLDHVVNTLDFSLLNSRWLQNYPPYDLFVDGLINSLDFAIFSSNWGKTW